MLIHQLIHKHLELPGLEQRSVRGAEPSSAGPPEYQISWSELPMTPLFSTTKHTTSTVPYPPDFNEYNPTQEETLRKKEAKTPPYCFLFPFLFLFPPLKNKDTRTTNAGRKHHKESWRPHTVVKPKPEITTPPPTHFWKTIIYI